MEDQCIALDGIHYKAKGPLRHINLDLSEFDTASALMLSFAGKSDLVAKNAQHRGQQVRVPKDQKVPKDQFLIPKTLSLLI